MPRPSAKDDPKAATSTSVSEKSLNRIQIPPISAPPRAESGDDFAGTGCNTSRSSAAQSISNYYGKAARSFPTARNLPSRFSEALARFSFLEPKTTVEQQAANNEITLAKIVASIDKDGDGRVRTAALRNLGLHPDTYRALQHADKDKDGKVSMEELVAAMSQLSSRSALMRRALRWALVLIVLLMVAIALTVLVTTIVLKDTTTNANSTLVVYSSLGQNRPQVNAGGLEEVHVIPANEASFALAKGLLKQRPKRITINFVDQTTTQFEPRFIHVFDTSAAVKNTEVDVYLYLAEGQLPTVESSSLTTFADGSYTASASAPLSPASASFPSSVTAVSYSQPTAPAVSSITLTMPRQALLEQVIGAADGYEEAPPQTTVDTQGGRARAASRTLKQGVIPMLGLPLAVAATRLGRTLLLQDEWLVHGTFSTEQARAICDAIRAAPYDGACGHGTCDNHSSAVADFGFLPVTLSSAAMDLFRAESRAQGNPFRIAAIEPAKRLQQQEVRTEPQQEALQGHVRGVRAAAVHRHVRASAHRALALTERGAAQVHRALLAMSPARRLQAAEALANSERQAREMAALAKNAIAVTADQDIAGGEQQFRSKASEEARHEHAGREEGVQGIGEPHKHPRQVGEAVPTAAADGSDVARRQLLPSAFTDFEGDFEAAVHVSCFVEASAQLFHGERPLPDDAGIAQCLPWYDYFADSATCSGALPADEQERGACICAAIAGAGNPYAPVNRAPIEGAAPRAPCTAMSAPVCATKTSAGAWTLVQPIGLPECSAAHLLPQFRAKYFADAAETPGSAGWQWNLERVVKWRPDYNTSAAFPELNFCGRNVHVFVLDSGLNMAHADFADAETGRSRVGVGYNAMASAALPQPSSSSAGDMPMSNRACSPTDNAEACADKTGHGTHLAGIVAGLTHGIATCATVHAVKVTDSHAVVSLTAMRAAVAWVLQYTRTSLGADERAIVLSSSTTWKSAAVDSLFAALVRAGATVAVAAGNADADACGYSPANLGGARGTAVMTVAATALDDSKALFSNWGRCVDVWAPGVSVPSASARRATDYAVKSGTSMAAPLVAGVAAIVAEAYPDFTPMQIKQWILRHAREGAVKAFVPADALPAAYVNEVLGALSFDEWLAIDRASRERGSCGGGRGSGGSTIGCTSEEAAAVGASPNLLLRLPPQSVDGDVSFWPKTTRARRLEIDVAMARRGEQRAPAAATSDGAGGAVKTAVSLSSDHATKVPTAKSTNERTDELANERVGNGRALSEAAAHPTLPVCSFRLEQVGKGCPPERATLCGSAAGATAGAASADGQLLWPWRTLEPHCPVDCYCDVAAAPPPVNEQCAESAGYYDYTGSPCSPVLEVRSSTAAAQLEGSALVYATLPGGGAFNEPDVLLKRTVVEALALADAGDVLVEGERFHMSRPLRLALPADGSAKVSLDYAFNFLAEVYDTIYVNENGYACFEDSLVRAAAPTLENHFDAKKGPCFSFFFADLEFDDRGDAGVYVTHLSTVTGDAASPLAPHSTVITYYKATGFADESSATNSVQAQLFYYSNDIRITYGHISRALDAVIGPAPGFTPAEIPMTSITNVFNLPSASTSTTDAAASCGAA